MWEVTVVVLQLACLAILVAAAIVSIGLPGWTKTRIRKFWPH